MKHFILLLFFSSPVAAGEIYQWADSGGIIHFSDQRPESKNVTVIEAKTPIVIKKEKDLSENETRITSWEVTEYHDNHVIIAVKYYYDNKFKDNAWLSAATLDNGSSSMNYSVRPARMKAGENIANIWLGVNQRAPNRHCTNQIRFSMYGKDIPTFHKATVNFSKCWTNSYIKPTESHPVQGIN